MLEAIPFREYSRVAYVGLRERSTSPLAISLSSDAAT